jgi:eukaryotic-like serine/threonine-protein kinase
MAGGKADQGSSPERIGRYRVLHRIGRGAMGSVYAAEDETLGRQVAIKVMMSDLQDEPQVRERFYREAKVTAQLLHRNIVTVFEFGEHDGHPYLAMELLSGLPLADYLATPAATGSEAKMELMQQTLKGLEAAHARGIVHRDIKPSNLFVQDDGTLKILDFGVARLSTSDLTVGGVVPGTPEYMSPEQAQGRQVDARSDLFSAAAVFYFMVAGRGPFASPDLRTVMRAVVQEDPAPLTDADAPESLRRVLMRGLAKSPADRYQRADEMLADLERVHRSYAAVTRRTAQAALDRYRQTLRVIDERRELAHTLGLSNVEAECEEAAWRLGARFPMFAGQSGATMLQPMERATATAALDSLQKRHNAEAAALEALREDAVDRMRGGERR